MLRASANLKWLFTERPVAERFEAAAKAGFSGVEFATPYDHSQADLKRWLDDAGLKQVLINTPIGTAEQGGTSGFACNPERRAEFRAGINLALEYAVGLDCGLVHLMAGIKPAGVSDDAVFAQYVANVAWATELAASANVTLVLEAINQRSVPGFFLRTQERSVAVINAIGQANLRLLFDVFHCQVEQGDVSHRLATLMPLIGHIQVADAPHRGEPGTGETAWQHVFPLIEKLGYDGWIGCEYKPVADTESGLGWLKTFEFTGFS